MAIRPAKCYRVLKRPWTRQSRKKPKKSYVVGVPGSKVVSFTIGDRNVKHDVTMDLVADQDIQIRHNALESLRTNANKILSTGIGKTGYSFKILVYPHHVMRENKMATGAGADRLQQGMRSSFGKPTGTAARVKKGQSVLRISFAEDKMNVAKEAMRIANYKMPGKYSVKVTKN